TTLCSCKLCPIPGIYAVTSILFDKRTRAYLRKAELGFLGVNVPTRVHTPHFCGELTLVKRFLNVLYPRFNAGESDVCGLFFLPFLINLLIVGICIPPFLFYVSVYNQRF